MDVDPRGIEIMAGKARLLLVRFDEMDLRAALILKQDILSLGGDAALTRSAAGLKVDRTPVLIMGTVRQLSELALKLKDQPFGLGAIADSIGDLLENAAGKRVFLVGGEDLLLVKNVLVMGVLNVTDDSFSDGGRFLAKENAVERGVEMASQGADIIDVGGESTRPGSPGVSAELESSRVVPVISALAREGVKNISVDTTKAEVAAKALDAGAGIVNDISGMFFDPAMAETVSDSGASAVLMHTAGKPDRMQEDTDYEDLLGSVYAYLMKAVDGAIAAGIARENLCVDPGIGFGKTPEQNLELLGRVGELRSLGTAVMVGASRKSFIGHYLGLEVADRVEGSLAAAISAVMCGADMVRVHDVTETVRAIRLTEKIRQWRV